MNGKGVLLASGTATLFLACWMVVLAGPVATAVNNYHTVKDEWATFTEEHYVPSGYRCVSGCATSTAPPAYVPSPDEAAIMAQLPTPVPQYPITLMACPLAMVMGAWIVLASSIGYARPKPSS